MNMFKKIVFGVSCLSAAMAGATDLWWNQNVSSGNWCDAGNWCTDSGCTKPATRYPQKGDKAIFIEGNGVEVTIDQAVTISTLQISASAVVTFKGGPNGTNDLLTAAGAFDYKDFSATLDGAGIYINNNVNIGAGSAFHVTNGSYFRTALPYFRGTNNGQVNVLEIDGQSRVEFISASDMTFPANMDVTVSNGSSLIRDGSIKLSEGSSHIAVTDGSTLKCKAFTLAKGTSLSVERSSSATLTSTANFSAANTSVTLTDGSTLTAVDCNVLSGCQVSLAGRSQMTVTGTFKNGGASTMTIDDSTVVVKGYSYFATSGTGGDVVLFKGDNPLMFLTGEYTRGDNSARADGALFNFEVPSGGFFEPPLQVFNPSRAFFQEAHTSTKAIFNVTAVSPALTAGKATDCPLAFFLKGITRARATLGGTASVVGTAAFRYCDYAGGTAATSDATATAVYVALGDGEAAKPGTVVPLGADRYAKTAVTHKTVTVTALVTGYPADAATVARLYVGDSADGADMTLVETKPVTEVGLISFDWTAPAQQFERTYYFKVQLVALDGEGGVCETQVIAAKTVDSATYTWKFEKTAGDWSDPDNWTSSIPDDCRGYPNSTKATAKFTAHQRASIRLTEQASLASLDCSAFDVGIAFVQGGADTNATRLTTSGITMGEQGVLTLDGVALRANAIVTMVASGTLRIINGSDFYSNDFYQRVGDLELSGSTFSCNQYIFGGRTVLDDSVMTVRNNFYLGDTNKGARFRIQGRNACILHTNTGAVFRSNLAGDDARFEFLVPAGGFARTPIQGVGNHTGVFAGSNSAIGFDILPESPAFNAAETLEQPLVAWPGKNISKTLVNLGETAGATFAFTPEGSAAPTGLSVTIAGRAHADTLKVSGWPVNAGTGGDPAYGDRTGLTEGAKVSCTAPAAFTGENDKGSVTGWKLYAIDPETHERVCKSSGNGTTYSYTHDGTWHELEWQWDYYVKASAVSADPTKGTLTPVNVWVKWGEEPEYEFTPATGYRFRRFDENGAAVFTRVWHVANNVDASDDNDGTTVEKALLNIQTAIDRASDDDFIDVHEGTYGYISGAAIDSMLWTVNVNKRVDVVAVDGPEATIIDAGTDKARSELRVTADGALVAGFTLVNGSGGGNKSWHCGIYASAGTVSNCTVTVRALRCASMLRLQGTARLYDIRVPSFTQQEQNKIADIWGYAEIDRLSIPGGFTLTDGGTALYVMEHGVLRHVAVTNVTVKNGTFLSLGGYARLENATISGVHTLNDSSAIKVDSPTTFVRNSVIYGNAADMTTYADIYKNNNYRSFFDCCCAQLPAGVNGNVAEDPQFVDPANGDYTLKPLSKCVDHGTIPAKDDPQYGTLDLAGNPRVFGKSLDIGAFECQVDPASVPLDIAFDPSATTSVAGESLECTFSAYAVGDTTGMQVVWDFGDGTTSDDWPAATHLYEVPGRYTVSLTVTTAKETKTYAIDGCITVIPRKTYVSKTGSNTYPYDNPEKAAADLEDALQTHCAEVEVGDGVFTNSVSEHLVTWPVYVHSANGKDNTTLKAKSGNPARHFRVLKDGAGTRISGFTLLGGGSGTQDWHGGLHLEAGLVDHCTLTNCTQVGRNSVCYLTGDARVEDCVVDFGDIAATWDGTQTGFRLEGKAVVDRCRISRWKVTAGLYHCAVLLNSADCVLRNSFVTGCTGAATLDSSMRSSAVYVDTTGGTVESCTITGNSCAGYGGGLCVAGSAGRIANTIVYGNTAMAGYADVYAGSLPASSVSNSCFSDPYLPNGYDATCTLANPNFDAENLGHLTVYSVSQIDGGATPAWATEDAVDLDGNPRVFGESIDMGCYEFQGGGHVDLDGTIDLPAPSGRVPFTAAFTASLIGDQTGLAGTWRFGDGTTAALSELAQDHVYDRPGIYTVTLEIANAAGESRTLVCAVPVTAVPQTCYVSKDGGSVAPYDTWEKAATNIHDAVELNPGMVLVTDGVYRVSKQIVLLGDTTIRSVNGAAATTLDAEGKCRIVSIQHADARVEGFTLTRGTGGYGQIMMADLTAGVLSHCIVTNPVEGGREILMWASGDSRIEDCVIHYGKTTAGNGDGTHIWGVGLEGNAVADRCVFRGWEMARTNNGDQHALYLAGNSTVRNSLVADCHYTASAGYNGGSGYNESVIRIAGGTLENCTVANCSVSPKNDAQSTGRRTVYITKGTVRNCIFSGNEDEFGVLHDLTIGGGTVTHSRSVDLTDGVDGNITADPRLRNPAKGDYRLRQNSPCVNAGAFAPWMTGATDYLGNPRVFNLKVDMGACENQTGGLVLMVK